MIVFYQVFVLLTVLQNFLCGNDKIAKMVDLLAKAESHLLQLKKYRSSEFELYACFNAQCFLEMIF